MFDIEMDRTIDDCHIRSPASNVRVLNVDKTLLGPETKPVQLFDRHLEARPQRARPSNSQER